MGLFPAVLGNGNRKSHLFLIVLAMMAFLLGMLSSPFSALLKCQDPRRLAKFPVVLKGKPTDLSAAGEMSSTDWTPADLLAFPSKCGDPIASSDVRNLLLEKVFDGISPFEGFPPEYAKPWLRGKRIKGWGSNGEVFERLITEVKPRIVVELGTYLGASAIHMVTISKSQDRDTLVLCIDDFRGWPGFRVKFKFEQIHADVQLLYQFMQNVQIMNLTESILPVPFSTTAAMAALCQWGVYADLIEVDAAHDFHSAWTDINFGHLLLRPGGVMFGHDYFTKLDNRGVGRAVDLFAKLKGLRVEPDGQHWILRSR